MTVHNAPDISVIIPTYNRKHQLLCAITSLAKQSVTSNSYEVLVVIDGATDDTEVSLASLSVPFRMQWICQARSGPGASRNLGAERALGDVLLFLDDDHIASPQLLERHLSHHLRSDRLLVQGYYPLAPWSRRTGISLLMDRKHRMAMRKLRRDDSGDLWGGNYSIRRTHFRDVGGYESETFVRATGQENVDLGRRLRSHGVRFLFDAAALSYHDHERSYEEFIFQCDADGRESAHLAWRYGRSADTGLRATSNAVALRRAFRVGWEHAPTLMSSTEPAFGWLLRACDKVGPKWARVAAAALARRYYKEQSRVMAMATLRKSGINAGSGGDSAAGNR